MVLGKPNIVCDPIMSMQPIKSNSTTSYIEAVHQHCIVINPNLDRGLETHMLHDELDIC